MKHAPKAKTYADLAGISEERGRVIETLKRERGELVTLIGRITNLARHPLFHEQTELPAWDEAIEQARAALAKLNKGV